MEGKIDFKFNIDIILFLCINFAVCLRFKTFPNDDIDHFIFQNKIKIQGVKHCHISNYFANFVPKKVNLEEIQNIPPMELDKYLCKFVVDVRQKMAMGMSHPTCVKFSAVLNGTKGVIYAYIFKLAPANVSLYDIR